MNGTLDGKRCAIYARYSSDRQRESSIEDQVRRCTEFIVRGHGTVDPSLIFTDFAMSGASMQRPAFEALLALVQAQPPNVDVIVTEDLSRLTRDFADAAQIFKVIKYAQVRMLGVGDGIDTDDKASKLTYGIKALVVDVYRDDLADKTRRGLEGRVRNGYSAGGLAYGFRSTPETGPDGRVIGHRLSIDEETAVVVRRVFRMSLEGHSLAAIAMTLNAESMPPPRAHTKHRRKGWVASTIRAMLHNVRYTGVWTFGEREWVRVPGSNKRRPRRRAESEVLRVERNDLRIIDSETWQAVQDRLAGVHASYTVGKDGRPKGRAIPGKATGYLLSGLLVCNDCGAPLIISGTAPSTRTYRCADHLKRGTCPSRIAVREEPVRLAVIKGVLDVLGRPEAVAYLRERIIQRLREVAAEKNAELKGRERHGQDLERKIANLVGFIAAGNASPSVAAALRDLEAEAARQKGAMKSLAEVERLPRMLPSVQKVVAQIMDLGNLLQIDPTAGREALRTHLAGGRLVVKLLENGDHHVSGDLIPLEFLVPLDKIRDRNGNQAKSVSSNGSGGWI